MASIKKTGENAYQIVVSCGYNSIGKKIRRKITYKPELLTAKGNPKSAASIEKDVAAFAADFERKVLTGQYTDGHIMTFEKYAAKYLAEYAEEPGTADASIYRISYQGIYKRVRVYDIGKPHAALFTGICECAVET